MRSLTFLSLCFLLTACGADLTKARADYDLGVRFLQGIDGAKDLAKAVEYLTLASKEGSADAQLTLGYLYVKGESVKKDEVRGFTLFKQAAMQGNRDGEYNTGLSYVKGIGTKVDLKEAFTWFHRAALLDDIGSEFNLGVMYINGEGTVKDALTAYAWFKEAADNGYEGAKEAMDKVKASLSPDELKALDAVVARVDRQIRRQKAAEMDAAVKTQPL